MRSLGGCLTGCFIKLLFGAALITAGVWALMVLMNPWALHIGGRSTPLLYWHGTGTVVAKNGKTYPLYVSFWPGRPGRHNGGRREGKGWSADLTGQGWLCVAPGNPERMNLTGTMYGGYTTDANSLLDFRLLEWRKPFSINYQHRGFFDIAGTWHGQDLVMDRPNEQGIPFQSGILIDRATVTLHSASYDEFQSACRVPHP
ncbi:MAG TPA: hypothetical protein VKR52_08480 [Terracidiphilus sp.]|nr:hypothetical protein [Terracidiphilus sp.]